MKKTPFFPAWRARLAPLKAAIQNARSQPAALSPGTLRPLGLQGRLLVPPQRGPGSRRRVFPLELTFWAFLEPNPQSGRQVAGKRCARSWPCFVWRARTRCADEQTGGWSVAAPLRTKPASAFDPLTLAASHGTHRPSRRRRFPQEASMAWGREVKVVDGSTATLHRHVGQSEGLPATAHAKKPGCGFPIMAEIRRPVFPWPPAAWSAW